ncbi:MAG TPA: hypothetical protein VF595_15310, partial [Tepidisphaeraceae bacterium]
TAQGLSDQLLRDGELPAEAAVSGRPIVVRRVSLAEIEAIQQSLDRQRPGRQQARRRLRPEVVPFATAASQPATAPADSLTLRDARLTPPATVPSTVPATRPESLVNAPPAAASPVATPVGDLVIFIVPAPAADPATATAPATRPATAPATAPSFDEVP